MTPPNKVGALSSPAQRNDSVARCHARIRGIEDMESLISAQQLAPEDVMPCVSVVDVKGCKDRSAEQSDHLED